MGNPAGVSAGESFGSRIPNVNADAHHERREPLMSRAFVKESDDDLTAGELPERPVPVHANYVTPHGMELLRMRGPTGRAA